MSWNNQFRKQVTMRIACLSRYELIHETLRLFYNDIKKYGELDSGTEERLDEILKFKGNKVVYTSTSDEIKTKIQEIGKLIYKALLIFSKSQDVHYKTFFTTRRTKKIYYSGNTNFALC